MIQKFHFFIEIRSFETSPAFFKALFPQNIEHKRRFLQHLYAVIFCYIKFNKYLKYIL